MYMYSIVHMYVYVWHCIYYVCTTYIHMYVHKLRMITVRVCMYVHTYVHLMMPTTIFRAAEFVGLTVHQLMNDNTAVALNYGVFRRQEFNVTPQVCV